MVSDLDPVLPIRSSEINAQNAEFEIGQLASLMLDPLVTMSGKSCG
jgi:hypothetical protein